MDAQRKLSDVLIKINVSRDQLFVVATSYVDILRIQNIPTLLDGLVRMAEDKPLILMLPIFQCGQFAMQGKILILSYYFQRISSLSFILDALLRKKLNLYVFQMENGQQLTLLQDSLGIRRTSGQSPVKLISFVAAKTSLFPTILMMRLEQSFCVSKAKKNLRSAKGLE